MPYPPARRTGWRWPLARDIASRLAGIALLIAIVPLARAAGTAPAAPGDSPATGPADAATAARMRLISQEQYFNSLGYVFGPDIQVAAHFAPFARTDGLVANGSASAGVTIAQMQEFQRTAASLAAQVVGPANRAYLVPCKPRDEARADPACARKFLLPVGRLLFRRPLDKSTADAVVARSGEAANQLHDFYGGLAAALEGLLMAPQSLFITDRAEPDPTRPGYARLDGYSLASRLSFFLWNAAPDDELLRAAEAGQLATANGLAKQVDRMLASPRLETGVRLSSTTCCASTTSPCSRRIPASIRHSAPRPWRTRASRRCGRSSTSWSSGSATTATCSRAATPSCRRRSPSSTAWRRRPAGRPTRVRPTARARDS
jgi:hypothetical protein